MTHITHIMKNITENIHRSEESKLQKGARRVALIGLRYIICKSPVSRSWSTCMSVVFSISFPHIYIILVYIYILYNPLLKLYCTDTYIIIFIYIYIYIHAQSGFCFPIDPATDSIVQACMKHDLSPQFEGSKCPAVFSNVPFQNKWHKASCGPSKDIRHSPKMDKRYLDMTSHGWN